MLRQLPLLFVSLASIGCSTVSDTVTKIGDMVSGSDSGSVRGAAQVAAQVFAGAVVADEPHAVIAGRTALNQTGTAADAAAAIYFTLSATLPSSASLGGGGMCVIYDALEGRVEALDFTARAPRTIPAGADRPSAVPGNALGFWLLHARYGRLPWSQVVAPGERLAQLGVQATRALVAEMAPVVAPLLEDPESRRVFADATGRPIGEGALFVQSDLARALSIIRVRGADEMYRGAFAAELVAGVKAAGGSLEREDLQAFKPEWRATVQVEHSSSVAHFAPPPAAAGAVEAQMFAMLDDRSRFAGANAVAQMHALAEVGARAFADRGRWMREDFLSSDPLPALVSGATLDRLMRSYDGRRHTPSASLVPPPVARPENPAATSFVTVDARGSAVACALTMNNNFGTGRIARGTGILLAAVPSQQGRGPTSLGPMVSVNAFSKQLFFAAAASGGVAAPTALVNVAARVLLDGRPIDSAMRARRIHHGGAPDLTYYEPGIARDEVMALTALGHTVAATPQLGLVNAISCPEGMPRRPNSCIAMADPRGSGGAASVGAVSN